MNPFEKLRKTIDKVQLNYQYPDKKNTNTVYNETNSFRQTNPQMGCTTNNNFNAIPQQNNLYLKKLWEDKQTQYIRQINGLTSQLQNMAKSFKLSQARNQELVKEICSLQKTNEQLLRQIQNTNKKIYVTQERQRKYKQQILRVNKTIQQLGNQLNNQRIQKKSLSKELQNLKSLIKDQQNVWKSQKAQFQNKIKSLKQEVAERAKMLEFNIKQNSQDRKELKQQFEKIRLQNQKSTQYIRKELDHYKKSFYETQNSLQLEQCRHQTSKSNIQSLNDQILKLKNQTLRLTKSLQQKESEIQSLQQKSLQLQSKLDQLNGQLIFERSNIKIKVVQVRDQTTEMQLQLYKKQYKQLLQQKAILQSFNGQLGGRPTNSQLSQHQYQIISKQERTENNINYQTDNLQQILQNQKSKSIPVNSKANYGTK